MADLSDPNIVQAYTEIQQHQATNWMLLGYHDTRDVITLYSKGTGGLSEFRDQLRDEVLYGFVRVEDRFILIIWISDQVSGVRRARALVHSRSVASLLKAQNATLTASSLNDLSDNNIRARLKLDTASKRISKRHSQIEEFVEASEEMPPPSPTTTSTSTSSSAAAATAATAATAAKEAAQEEERQAALRRKNAEDEKRRADMAAAAAKERARVAVEEEEKRKKQEARAEIEARSRKARELEEDKRRQALRAQEEDRQKKAEVEQRRLQEEEAMKRKMREAEKNKDVMLSGFASVQPKTSPFWRRRYFTLRDKSLVLYRDDQDPNPIGVIDLKSVIRLSPIDEERETFLPNAFVIDTQKDGSFQLFADNRRECETIFTALLTVMKAN